MTFVNEYISDEDINNYGIDALWSRYYGKDSKLPGFRYSWTIDRERQAFLMSVKIGREEFSNRITFVLWVGGQVVEAELDKFGTGDMKEPITTIWGLHKLALPVGASRDREYIVGLLKDALTAYKVFGITWPVNAHTAVFKF